MQLILVKIKWHIKWKYLIKKFHDICLSYYFKLQKSEHGHMICNENVYLYPNEWAWCLENDLQLYNAKEN